MIKNIIKKFIPPFLLDCYHLALPFLGAVLYGFPARKLKVIGVTGTNGKSTVVYLTTKILEEAGFKVASLSSIKFKVREKEWQNTLKMTMPGRMKLQKFLRQAAEENCQFAVLEVTSEGIKQHRHSFIDFDVAVFTNLTPEHIEAHGSFEKYKEAKGKLFKACKNIHIINTDDKNSDYFWQFPAKEKITYQIVGERFSVNYGEPFSVNLKLPGRFNLYNAAAAICVGLSQGIDLETCQMAVEKVERIPGRMEKVVGEPFSVIVDYAHTPDALEKVYQTIQNTRYKIQDTKLICVLGACGGGRDKWKRPELGKIATNYCDQIILTNEDPYDEDPEQILEDIQQGAPVAQKILDRKEAIKKALSLAKPGDTVIITGKGSESWMCVGGGKKIPWDEKAIVLEEFKRRR